MSVPSDKWLTRITTPSLASFLVYPLFVFVYNFSSSPFRYSVSFVIVSGVLAAIGLRYIEFRKEQILRSRTKEEIRRMTVTNAAKRVFPLRTRNLSNSMLAFYTIAFFYFMFAVIFQVYHTSDIISVLLLTWGIVTLAIFIFVQLLHASNFRQLMKWFRQAHFQS